MARAQPGTLEACFSTATLPAIRPGAKKRKHCPEVCAKLEAAEQAFLSWKALSYAGRSKYLERVSEVLRSKKRQLAELMASEMGKPIKSGMAEIDKCALVCRYYADHAEQFLSQERVNAGGSESYITFQPLGVLFST